MTAIEFVDAIDAMLNAAIKWIMLGSAIASLLLLAAVAVVAWAAKRVRRGQAPASRPQGPGCGSRDAGGAPEPPEARTGPRHSHEQTGRKAA